MKNNKKYIALNPKDCLDISFEQSFNLLKTILDDETLSCALDIKKPYPSPLKDEKDTKKCRFFKMVGINPRITKTYWGIVKYALTLAENAIHIMPLFETGDGSLYVQNSWDLNDEFLDEDLIKLGYKTSAEQLKLVVNILHALGKVVGFDVSLHTDNFSKIVLLNPSCFEWVKLNETKTEQLPYNEVDYNLLYKDVENIIIETLNLDKDIFSYDEKKRSEIIFPKGIDHFKRRMELRKAIRDKGYEPICVIEHAPCRPVVFNRMVSDGNENWAEFFVKDKDNSAKIFGAITPYRFYYLDNKGYPKKDDIIKKNWDYVSDKISAFQEEFNFDFLRADMAHNQIAHSHAQDEKDFNCPEIWKYIRQKIQKTKPYFSTFAEAFYEAYYIDGFSDMINKDFDLVLGEMNFKDLDETFLNITDDFLNPFRQHFRFQPCMTIFSNDGDLSEHNIFYQSNEKNLVRCFISLFLNLPSYMGMGFEIRDINPQSEQNYSHDYVRKLDKDYCFGSNIAFFEEFTKLRKFYLENKEIFETYDFKQVYSLDNKMSLCFEYEKERKGLLFIVNFADNTELTLNTDYKTFKPIFSLEKTKEQNNKIEIQKWSYAVYEFRK